MERKIADKVLLIIILIVPILIFPAEKYNILKVIFLYYTSCFLILPLIKNININKMKCDNKELLVIIFIIIAAISTTLSSNIKISILGRCNRFEGLLMLSIYIIIYISSKRYESTRYLDNFINIAFYILMGIFILGIMQMYIKCEKLYPIFNKGVCSTFGNCNFFGSFLSITIPIITLIFIYKKNVKAMILSILAFYDLLICGTRSALVAFFIYIIILCIYIIKGKNKIYFRNFITLIICFSLITTIFVIFNKDSYGIRKIKEIKNDIITAKQGNIEELGSDRLGIWKMCIKLIYKNPLIGVRT